ncbi:MAG: C40 family peptidase [Desulfosporosinus sp.]|nr:C40 family peptidase [Desulfosporosinus sp.]
MKKSILLTLVIAGMISSTSVAQAATLTAGASTTKICMLQSGLRTLTAVQKSQRDANLPLYGTRDNKGQEALIKSYKPPQQKNTKIIKMAKSLLGVKFLWGGTTPAGFDCSGFTCYVFASQKISLPRMTLDQYVVGIPLAFNNLIPGDLVFFNLTSGTQVSFVGIYLGNDKFISATLNKGVTIYSFSPYWTKAYVGARRVN